MRAIAARFVVLVSLLLTVGWGASAKADIGAADAAALLGVEPAGIEAGADGASPPAIAVRRNGALIGYVLSTWAVAGTVGYAGKPLDILVGLGMDGRIKGARLVAHEEPILVIGVSPAALTAFVASLAGIDIREPVLTRRPGSGVSHVAGATVSSTVFKDAVVRSARAVAYARGIIGDKGKSRRSVDRASFAQRSWSELEGAKAIARRTITRGELAEALATKAAAPAEPFIELMTALATPPTIGQSLVGRRAFEAMSARLAEGDNAVVIAARGAYSFMGTKWRQDGRFDRVRLVQGARTIALSASDFENIERLAAEGAPEWREIGVLRIAEASGFDPAAPWRLELIVEQDGKGPAIFALDYTLPEAFLLAAPARPASAADTSKASRMPSVPSVPSATGPLSEPTLAEEIWRTRRGEIVVLGLMLAVLTSTLFFHDIIVTRIKLYRRFRLSFLAVSLLFLGFYAGAQLSVINVVTFLHAVLHGFRWEQFLLDPLIFILWCFVALCLLFWGRGVFCGWLCPFGALQELLNEIARKLKVPQIEVPWPLHERLWPIKYTLFLAILGLSFQSTLQAVALAEVEPFKTTIALKMMRAWPYVLYVVALLGIGLFIERFYCRYVCPLGAALAIPARLKIFDWLKRRPQCGRECRICATRCTVQAINPLGQITPNECIYCLQCQANYYDATTCLPLKQRALRRGGAAAGSAAAKGEAHE